MAYVCIYVCMYVYDMLWGRWVRLIFGNSASITRPPESRWAGRKHFPACFWRFGEGRIRGDGCAQGGHAIDCQSGLDDLRNNKSSTNYRGVAFSKSREHKFACAMVGKITRKNRCLVRFFVGDSCCCLGHVDAKSITGRIW